MIGRTSFSLAKESIFERGKARFFANVNGCLQKIFSSRRNDFPETVNQAFRSLFHRTWQSKIRRRLFGSRFECPLNPAVRPKKDGFLPLRFKF